MRRKRFGRRKFARRKISTIKVLFLLLFGISIGFAALNTSLKLTGTASIKRNTWDIYWDNLSVTSGSVAATSAATINPSDPTTISYEVSLNNPGDFYEFTVDAYNNGSIDAMIGDFGILAYESDGTTLKSIPTYLDYSITYANGGTIAVNHLLESQKSESYRVRLFYKTNLTADQLPSTNETTIFKFNVAYIQANGEAVDLHPVKILSGTKGNLQPGDKVRIGSTEDFYVISSDNTTNGKTVLLAKYCLKVGNIIENWNVTGLMDSTTPGYGLQSIDTLGSNGTSTYEGTVAFSSTAYWDGENVTLLSPYNENNTIYYDSNYEMFKYTANDNRAYPYVYDSNSNIYQYISGNGGYVSKLIDMGAPSTITGRLLTYEEADALGEVQDNNQSIIFNGTTYWLGVARDDDDVWDVYYGGDFGSAIYGYNHDAVRPVIEIYTADIG